MSETKNKMQKNKAVLAVISAVVYLVAYTGFFGALGGIVKLFGLSVFLLCTGRRGFTIIIIPMALTAVTGYASDSAHAAVLELISVISYAASAAVISQGFAAKKNKAYICALGSFTMTVFTLMSTAIDFLIAANAASVRFTTFFFDSVEKFINSYIELYGAMMENAANSLPQIYAQTATLPEINTEALHSSLTLIITLLPAFMYCLYFALCFICASLINICNRKFNLVPGVRFGKYNVSGITHGVFTILGTILVFSLFFEAELSAFTLGVLSVLIAILPHFIIFAYRFLYKKLYRLCGKAGSVILLAIITGVCFAMAPYLTLLVLSFIGTHEYRAQRIIKIIR